MPAAKRPVNIDVEIGLDVICIYLTEGETLTWAEIADICGCSKSLIKSIEVNAIKKLRKKLKIENFDLV